MSKLPSIVLDAFALRQFNNPSLPSSLSYDPTLFLHTLLDYYHKHPVLADGYMPFCKHIFLPNFTNSACSYMRIEEANQEWLKTEYLARTAHELPVLTRYFPKEKVESPVATYLDIILYSREQINKENRATSTPLATKMVDGVEDAEWGIISIKSQLTDKEIPMLPITAMRNALPLLEGGSGTPLNREEYMKSVEFWKDHAMIQ